MKLKSLSFDTCFSVTTQIRSCDYIILPIHFKEFIRKTIVLQFENIIQYAMRNAESNVFLGA